MYHANVQKNNLGKANETPVTPIEAHYGKSSGSESSCSLKI